MGDRPTTPNVGGVEIDNPSPGDVADPLLSDLHRYWRAKRGDRTMPARSDIDPLEMGAILGQLILVDVLHPGPRFRIRLHGSVLSMRAGYELTGKMLDELPITEFRTLAAASFTKVATTGLPFWSRRDRILDGRPTRYETLMLPLSPNGRSVDMLLVGLRYLPTAKSSPSGTAAPVATPKSAARS